MLVSPSRSLLRRVTLSGVTLILACNSATGPGSPTALRAVTGDAQLGPEGQLLPVPLTVQVLDAGGRGVAGVTVTWTVTGGGGSLQASAFPTVTDSVGLALVFWQLGSLGPQSVFASCCPSVQTTTTFTARALLPFSQRLTVIGGQWQFDTVGHTLALPIVAHVLRTDGKPDVGAVVGWGTQTPGGHFSPTFVSADSAGHASTLWTLGTVAGTETSWVRVAGLPEVPVFATAYAGPPVRLTITPNPLPLLGAIDESVVPAAQAWDRYGNLIPGTGSLAAADTTIVRVSAYGAVMGRHHGTTWVRGQYGPVRDSVQVTMLGFSAVSHGVGHYCGLSLAGDKYCWGFNASGAIGDGTVIDRPHPVRVGAGLALGLPYIWVHTCALTTGGQAYCWGPDESGQLGDGSANYTTVLSEVLPTPVSGGLAFSTIRVGGGHTCAIATTGATYCWGSNSFGQLGRDTVTQTCAWSTLYGYSCSNAPILVSGGLQFTQVTAGAEHTCGLTASGAAYCWGRNEEGELGNDSTKAACGSTQPNACSYVPLLVEGGLTFKSVKAAVAYTCGVTVSGDGYCWGGGTPSVMPVKIAGGLVFVDLEAGNGVICGLTTTGNVYCWGGQNFAGTPTLVRPDLQFAALAVGGDAGCELTTTNDLYCFGN